MNMQIGMRKDQTIPLCSNLTIKNLLRNAITHKRKMALKAQEYQKEAMALLGHLCGVIIMTQIMTHYIKNTDLIMTQKFNMSITSII